MRVLDVMTTDVISVRADTFLTDAARLMFRSRVSGLPVLDAGSSLIGMITEVDFLRLEIARDTVGEVVSVEYVEEVMMTSVVTVDLESSVADAARIMVSHGLRRLPVVDSEDHLGGIISGVDVVAAFARPDDVVEDEIREDVLRRLLDLDPASVDVSYHKGVVTFTGTIGTKYEAVLLDKLVGGLDGVLRVENRLIWSPSD